jgi:L-alanine-DL-glutamate epimerase-like enolase superfamily enzyme
MRRLTVRTETWPIAGTFTIAHGAVTEVHLVVVEIEDGPHRGRGECRPYPRYGETPASVTEEIEALRADLEADGDRVLVQQRMKPGAARNAVDCTLWDLEAKRSGRRVWELAGIAAPGPIETAFTISIGTPAEMAEAAAKAAARPLLKIKLGGGDDLARLEAVRNAAPDARLIVDANEAWTPQQYTAMAPAFAQLGVALIEQPLPAGADAALADLPHPVPVCADESCHDRHGLADLARRYDAINVKLDKTGGLTEALALTDAASALGLAIMVGCMVATSLAMAPALLLANRASFVDLDGPLLLARDRVPGLAFDGSNIQPPLPALWG